MLKKPINKQLKGGIKFAESILKGSPYETNRKIIEKLFEKQTYLKYEDILLRLIVIDTTYSTNMKTSIFGIEELAKYIHKKKYKIHCKEDVEKFIGSNSKIKKILKKTFGTKKERDGEKYKNDGRDKKCALSLITKYFHYQSNSEFPIYDNIVLEELYNQGFSKTKKRYDKSYFDNLRKIKKDSGMSYLKLDKYFWVCGKVRKKGYWIFYKNAEHYHAKKPWYKQKNIKEINKILKKYPKLKKNKKNKKINE